MAPRELRIRSHLCNARGVNQPRKRRPPMIVVEAPAYVPYEPKTPELDALKAELQRQLKELAVGPGEILWAAFAGQLPSRADVENALFYNLDGNGAFARP
jgi:hypothetical protein